MAIVFAFYSQGPHSFNYKGWHSLLIKKRKNKIPDITSQFAVWYTRRDFEILIVQHFISLLLHFIPCFIIHEITKMGISQKKTFTIVLSILLFPHYIDCTTSKVAALATVATVSLAVTGNQYQYRIEHNTSYVYFP